MKKSICGVDCGRCELCGSCNGCAETDGQPFGAECVLSLIHISELKARKFFRQFLEARLVERVVFLSGRLGRGTVEAVCDQEGRRISPGPFLL